MVDVHQSDRLKHTIFQHYTASGNITAWYGVVPTPYRAYDGYGVFIGGTCDPTAARKLVRNEQMVPALTEDRRALVALWICDYTDASLGAHTQLQFSMFMAPKPLSNILAHPYSLVQAMHLLIRDGGVRGIVICLAQPHFTRIEVEALHLHCGAGAKLKDVANEAKRNGIAGLEFLEGIPGCVGGALRMNAGAYGSEMFRVVESLRFMDYAGAAHDVPAEQIQASYRNCPFFKTHIALGAVLKGQAGERAVIEQRMAECSQKRWSSQPKAPSAGCAFKNPAAIPAGRLVEELQLKGTRIGGAMVSLEHGNFIVTDNPATARDVLELMALIKQRALTGRGITLETEVQIIGSDDV